VESSRPHWDLHKPLSSEEIKSIRDALRQWELSPLQIQLLANRGIREPEEIEAFLDPPTVDRYPDPHLLVGMGAAVDRICRARDRSERVVVYGDFDCDGVTATALLTIALRRFGLEVEPYIPRRKEEGYGLNGAAVRELAARGFSLLITVDCGISGAKEVEEARRAGLDIIVTDHHTLPEELPAAAACINPKQYVDGCDVYGDLAGVGVAYQLVRALVKRCGVPQGLRNSDLLGLVAIGTIADVVPLKGANRSLVLQGLASLPKHSLPGIHALIERAGVKLGGFDTERIGFAIAPRLNAAGRMDDARVAYELLLTEDIAEASDLARKLDAHNRQRQARTNMIVDQAKARAREMDPSNRIVVLSDPDWDQGIIGLVAGRLVEEYGRPAVVMERGEETSRGSARSTPHFNIVEALAEVKDLLTKWGGHSAAAGFLLQTDKIPQLEERLRKLAGEKLDEGRLQTTLTADAELDVSQVHGSTLDAVNRLAPFGAGNPTPLFRANNARVLDARVIGETGAHLKLVLASQPAGPSSEVEAIGWRMGFMLPQIRSKPCIDLLFNIERDEYRGESRLRAKIRDLRLSA
jgi:single-stranded-DNA-specific exonuclease